MNTTDPVGHLAPRVPAAPPSASGATVAVLARTFGAWWISPARIVRTIDETTAEGARFGFASGTLPGHVESGEERFLIEWRSE